ncbi:DUF2336 domain-containing protein [Devosia aurantiaca]|uniref:DUF2336 domain-containing protein n=1 Tax=Devosia aurantiaca TaxID=2714858 RepID=A0A6M1SMA3_9HYPH|nr:DUF2336 domain-containing protein [Devosia aurantiaca]NGP17854.1 DUF2336 domain-containing protein [Devosia aurantiaca]
MLGDSPIISRAVLQYSPLLVDADLLPIVRSGDVSALTAIAERPSLSLRLVAALVARDEDAMTLALLRRPDVPFGATLLESLARAKGEDAKMRGAMLSRADLPAAARLVLVRCATASLRECRMVKGALAPERLERVLRDGADNALTIIGETASDDSQFVDGLVGSDQLNTRLLLQAMVTGHVMFFSACLASLAQLSREKVFVLLENGSRPALNALFIRCGLEPAISRLLVRLIMLARTADLSDDVAARHYVVTALTEELIAEYDGDIPPELEEAFAYLSAQNVTLARQAARGVMRAFAETSRGLLRVPQVEAEPQLQLPAA